MFFIASIATSVVTNYTELNVAHLLEKKIGLLAVARELKRVEFNENVSLYF